MLMLCKPVLRMFLTEIDSCLDVPNASYIKKRFAYTRDWQIKQSVTVNRQGRNMGGIFKSFHALAADSR